MCVYQPSIPHEQQIVLSFHAECQMSLLNTEYQTHRLCGLHDPQQLIKLLPQCEYLHHEYQIDNDVNRIYPLRVDFVLCVYGRGHLGKPPALIMTNIGTESNP